MQQASCTLAFSCGVHSFACFDAARILNVIGGVRLRMRTERVASALASSSVIIFVEAALIALDLDDESR